MLLLSSGTFEHGIPQLAATIVSCLSLLVLPVGPSSASPIQYALACGWSDCGAAAPRRGGGLGSGAKTEKIKDAPGPPIH